LSKHISRTDAWISLDGIVYDVTSYLRHHPGGAEKLLMGCGKESKKLFGKYLIKQINNILG
jgi:cytochrome b involved in lipid metabolism